MPFDPGIKSGLPCRDVWMLRDTSEPTFPDTTDDDFHRTLEFSDRLVQ